VLPALLAFVEGVCNLCPVGCLKKPRRSVANAFFSPEHPAPGPLRGVPDDGDPFRRGVVDDDYAD
jgi:hypothetical protein